MKDKKPTKKAKSTSWGGVAHWYDTVYMPIIKIIRESSILKEFPDKTEGDLYLWVLDHQHYLSREEGQPLQPPETAAKQFLKENE